MTRRWFVSLIYDPPAGQHSLDVFPDDDPFGFGEYGVGFRGDEVEVAVSLEAAEPLAAASQARDRVRPYIEAEPIAVEVVSQAEQQRRFDEPDSLQLPAAVLGEGAPMQVEEFDDRRIETSDDRPAFLVSFFELPRGPRDTSWAQASYKISQGGLFDVLGWVQRNSARERIYERSQVAATTWTLGLIGMDGRSVYELLGTDPNRSTRWMEF
jgi:hypothetical protein